MSSNARFVTRGSPILGRLVAGAVAGAVLASAPPVHALQDLGEFLGSARTRSFDNREAEELSRQREAEVDQAWGRIFPVLSAQATFARNQFEVEFDLPTAPGAPPETIVIQPANQFDAIIRLDVPLIDVAGWKRIGAAKALADATEARVASTGQEVERAIAQRYYQVLGAEALVEAGQRTLAAAEANQKIVRVRVEAGAATTIDLERAQAEVERARQSVADAELLRAVSRKALGTQTGLEPSPGGRPLDGDLTEEAPLDVWLGTDPEQLPGVRAAALEKKAADRASDAATLALIPTVTAFATERFTNATGFAGQAAIWQVGVTANWRLDYSTIATIRAQSSAARAAVVREDRSRAAARDRIHDAWQQVRAQIAKSRAARAQVAASAHAAELARQLYAEGAGTQIELIQAERDAFGAEVQRVQADADLALARVLLRVSAGKTPENGGSR